MPKSHLYSALVRLLVDDKSPRRPIGAGFVVSDRHILTCAHVVTDVLQISPETVNAPTESLWFDFPLVNHQPLMRAKVVKWFPLEGETLMGEIEDIAVLEITEGSLPQGVLPANVLKVDPDTLFDRAVRVCGFPEGMNEGETKLGLYDPSRPFDQGFSGTGWAQPITQPVPRS